MDHKETRENDEDEQHTLSFEVLHEEEHQTSSTSPLARLIETKSFSENKENNAESPNKSTYHSNIEELYEEILFQILNKIGYSCSQEVSPESLLEYSRQVFKISQEKHDHLVKIAQRKKPPKVLFNVGIIKAMDLLSSDDSYSYQFVTLYLQSNALHKYNTSTKPVMANTAWDEFFSFPIAGSLKKETLHIEVWKFLGIQANEKTGTLTRSLQGSLRRLSFLSTAKEFKMIGKTEVPLSSVSGSGIRVWYKLRKGLRRTRHRGSILLHLGISAEKHNRVAAQEHQILLKKVLIHELETYSSPNLWSGEFSSHAEAIIKQHYIQSGLTEDDNQLCQWIAYTLVHEDYPISFRLLVNILQKVIKILPTYCSKSDNVKAFWEAVKRLLPACYDLIRTIRQELFTTRQGIEMLCDVLKILQIVGYLSVPGNVDLFATYGYLSIEDTGKNDIQLMLDDTIRFETTEWLIKTRELCQADSQDPVQQAKKFVQLINFDMQRAKKFHHIYILEIMNLQYIEILFECYQKAIVEFCKPAVVSSCRKLVPLRVDDVISIDQLTMEIELFELYMSLKDFIASGTAAVDEELAVFHEWFTPAVTNWVEMSIQKGLFRIRKAIELDKFNPIDENVRHSSSALDTLAILHQIKIFWDELDWPDAEQMYLFLTRLLDGICRCCVYYATRTSSKILEVSESDTSAERFEVTKEWCLSICDINHIQTQLPVLTKDLGVEEALEKFNKTLSPGEAERCAETVKNIIVNCQDNLENQIEDLIATLVKKMVGVMRRLLYDSADSLNDGLNATEGLFMFLERSLTVLYAELAESAFDEVIDNISHYFVDILYELAHNSLDERRPPTFFINLREVLKTTISSLSNNNKPFSATTSKTLENTEKLLNLHASNTNELIHQYYKERLQQQMETRSSPYGQLTIRAHFTDKNALYVTILNGINLLPLSSKKHTDSYVKMYFIPYDRFVGVPTHKTAVISKNVFPLYDEEFKVHFTSPERKLSDNIVVFSVKDKDMLRMSNRYLSECYFSFEEIKKSNGQQIHLNLSRPEHPSANSDIVRALEYRQFCDKTARLFIKNLKERAAAL